MVLRIIGIAVFAVFVEVLALVSVQAQEKVSCPTQLQESQTQTLLVGQSRDQYEQRLAQAIRANRELSQMYDVTATELKRVTEELAKLKPKEGAAKE